MTQFVGCDRPVDYRVFGLHISPPHRDYFLQTEIDFSEGMIGLTDRPTCVFGRFCESFGGSFFEEGENEGEAADGGKVNFLFSRGFFEGFDGEGVFGDRFAVIAAQEG
jgi:hypothetical protein